MTIASAPPEARPRSRAETISTLVRLTLAGVFLVAGALKVVDPVSATRAVRAYQVLPETLASWVGWGLPFLEIALGLLLAGGILTRWSAALAGALLVVFIAGVVSAAARGLSIDCGCFGGGGPVTPGQTTYVGELLRDVGLLVLAAWLVWKPQSRFSLDRGGSDDLL